MAVVAEAVKRIWVRFCTWYWSGLLVHTKGELVSWKELRPLLYDRMHMLEDQVAQYQTQVELLRRQVQALEQANSRTMVR